MLHGQRRAGFTGTVATYNGTTSAAATAGFTNTNFDGTLPFTICQWVNPSTLSGFTQEIMLSNTSSTTGISVQLFGASSAAPGSYNVNLFSTLANSIQVRTSTATLTAGSINLACFKYSGTKLASGVTMYVNGATAAATVASDTISGGSIASSHVMQIGSNGGTAFLGAIGRVRIFNRALSDAEISAMYAAGPNAY
jgi:hypothetical protein